jgi:dihydrofolate synthase/folylpolyglutamate synthase
VTYPQAIQFLHDLGLFGARFGLENTLRLAELLGNPQKSLRFIHVAGTNGKGSVCAMLESIYRGSGLKTGLFTSPHLVSFRERIQINRELVTEPEVVALVAQVQAALRSFPLAQPPTFFEIVTVMALRHFADRACDLVIWETGLGGRLDATNIVMPLASVITNIQLDHEKWLGGTLAEIAAEKAGIIKPGIPVLTAARDAEALEVIANVARSNGAPMTVVPREGENASTLESVDLPLLGEHQRCNAELALATVRCLQRVLPVSDEAIRRGLAGVWWPGRFQIVRLESGQTIVLDGAHNPAGAETLRAGWERHFPGKHPALILGTLRDKDWLTMCRILAPLAGRILVCPVSSDRTTAPGELSGACRSANPQAQVEDVLNLAEALDKTRHESFVVVSGSLHFIGEAMEALKLSPSGLPDERVLNEWQPKVERDR